MYEKGSITDLKIDLWDHTSTFCKQKRQLLNDLDLTDDRRDTSLVWEAFYWQFSKPNDEREQTLRIDEFHLDVGSLLGR